MKIVTMQTPNATDGVSMYRHWGPMFPLQRQGHVLLKAMTDELKMINHWHFFDQCHFAFISRSAQLFDKVFAEECLKRKIPIWFDMDDNLFLVPDNSEAFHYYSTPEAKGTIGFILQNATVITVATHPLQKYLLNHYSVKSVIIENALNDDLLWLKKDFTYNKKIAWRGSGGGREALEYYYPALINLVQEFSTYDWQFYGFNPYGLTRRFEKHPIKWEKGNYFVDYMHGLTENNPSFSFLTHLNTEFDRTKSTNGWLESTLAGAVCLVPNIGDWSEISDEMVFKYKCMDLNDFTFKFQKMIKTPREKLEEMHKKSMEYIENNLLLSHINKKRIDIINSLGNHR